MGGRTSKGKSTARDLTPAEFVGLRPGVADALGGFANLAGQNAGRTLQDAFIPGPFANLSAGETASLGELGQFRGVDLNPLASSAQNRFLSPEFLDVGRDPGIQRAIEAATRPVFEGLSRAGRDASSAFAQAGQSPGQSSPFAREAGRLQSDALRAAGDISSGIVGGELARRQQLQSGAIGQAFTDRANQQAFQLQRQLETLQAQGLPRLVQELGIDRGIAEFNRQQAELLQGLELAVQASSPTVGTESKESSAGGGLLSGG